MIRYAVERYKDCIEELKPLLDMHYEEIAMYREHIEFDPDYDLYEKIDENGGLHMVVVRDEGRIIGYYVSFIHPNPHYKNDLFSVNDILFIHPDYRGRTVAFRMLKFTEEKLKEMGVSVMTLHMKVDFPFEELCIAFGMDKAEYLYTKYLGD
jgi:GNAT superfamily N-acetyltransferase